VSPVNIGHARVYSSQDKHDAGGAMGMLFRMFAPKPLKKAKRATHPVSLMTPRPVRKAKMAAVDTTHPAGAARRAAGRAAVRKVRGR